MSDKCLGAGANVRRQAGGRARGALESIAWVQLTATGAVCAEVTLIADDWCSNQFHAGIP